MVVVLPMMNLERQGDDDRDVHRSHIDWAVPCDHVTAQAVVQFFQEAG